MSIKIDYERIAAAKEKFESFIRVCDKVLDGKISVQRACKEENIPVQTFYNNIGRFSSQNNFKQEIPSGEIRYDLIGPDELMTVVMMDTPWVAPDNFMNLWTKYVTHILGVRECIVIEGLYFDGNTLEELSDIFGVTRERIRQIHFKALRKLRGVTKECLILRYGEDYITKLSEAEKEAYEEIERRKAEIEEEKNNRIQEAKDKILSEFKSLCDLDDTFDELELSVRSYNSIQRYMWINKRLERKSITIRVLAETPIEEYMRMRNMGRKSLDEIQQKLKEKYGVELKSEGEIIPEKINQTNSKAESITSELVYEAVLDKADEPTTGELVYEAVIGKADEPTRVVYGGEEYVFAK